MEVNEIMFSGVPWGTPCAVLLHMASQTPNYSVFADSARRLPSHGTEGRTSQPSESTAVCQLEIHCTAFNKFTQSLYVWIEPVNFTNACVLYHSINKNNRPGFDSESHLPEFLFRFVVLHSSIFLESCLSLASCAVISAS
jgi:hypothetical protein